MNHINQITRILNALYDIDYLKVCCTTVEDNMLIIDFTYDDERAICYLYNKVPGGYVVTNPRLSTGQLSFTLTETDNTVNTKNQKTMIVAFAYPDED